MMYRVVAVNWEDENLFESGSFIIPTDDEFTVMMTGFGELYYAGLVEVSNAVYEWDGALADWRFVLAHDKNGRQLSEDAFEREVSEHRAFWAEAGQGVAE